MPEENSAASTPGATKESLADPSPSTDRKLTPHLYVSSRIRRRMVILSVVLVVLVGGFFLWRYLTSYESTDDAQVDVHLYPVSARISGYVLKVNVDDNQFVQKGTVLGEMDPRDYQVAVERAKAELADAQATAQAMNLNVPVETIGTTTQVSTSEADLQATQAGVAAAQG